MRVERARRGAREITRWWRPSWWRTSPDRRTSSSARLRTSPRNLDSSPKAVGVPPTSSSFESGSEFAARLAARRIRRIERVRRRRRPPARRATQHFRAKRPTPRESSRARECPPAYAPASRSHSRLVSHRAFDQRQTLSRVRVALRSPRVVRVLAPSDSQTRSRSSPRCPPPTCTAPVRSKSSSAPRARPDRSPRCTAARERIKRRRRQSRRPPIPASASAPARAPRSTPRTNFSASSCRFALSTLPTRRSTRCSSGASASAFPFARVSRATVDRARPRARAPGARAFDRANRDARDASAAAARMTGAK